MEDASGDRRDAQVHSSINQFSELRTSALTGAATTGISLGLVRNVTTADWVRANSSPNIWPVEGLVTGSFGERIDPFNGEGAFHNGVDISSGYGQPVMAPADGVVEFADFFGGYGRAVILEHSRGVSDSIRPPVRVCGHHRTEGASRRHYWICRPKWSLDRSSSSLRSTHQ